MIHYVSIFRAVYELSQNLMNSKIIGNTVESRWCHVSVAKTARTLNPDGNHIPFYWPSICWHQYFHKLPQFNWTCGIGHCPISNFVSHKQFGISHILATSRGGHMRMYLTCRPRYESIIHAYARSRHNSEPRHTRPAGLKRNKNKYGHSARLSRQLQNMIALLQLGDKERSVLYRWVALYCEQFCEWLKCICAVYGNICRLLFILERQIQLRDLVEQILKIWNSCLII